MQNDVQHDEAAMQLAAMNQPKHQPKRKMGLCKKRDVNYLMKTASSQVSRQLELANGKARKTPQATLAAHTRARQSNQMSTLSRLFTQIGSILDMAAETGEDMMPRFRDAYLGAAVELTKPFGRILPSNRCADSSIGVIHQQISKLVHAGVIQPLSGNDPSLEETAAVADMTVQLVGQGPLRAPQPVLPAGMLPQLDSPAPSFDYAYPSPPPQQLPMLPPSPLPTLPMQTLPSVPTSVASVASVVVPLPTMSLLPPLPVLPTLVMAPTPLATHAPYNALPAGYIDSALQSSSPVDLDTFLRNVPTVAPKQALALLAAEQQQPATDNDDDNFF